MLEKLISLFSKEVSLTHSAALLNFAHQLIQFFTTNIQDESARNAAIDAFIEILQQQKTNTQ